MPCAQSRFLQILVRTLCVLGVGMIMGDGVLTPAISVVSAIEGLGQIPGGGGTIERSESASHLPAFKHAPSHVPPCTGLPDSAVCVMCIIQCSRPAQAPRLCWARLYGWFQGLMCVQRASFASQGCATLALVHSQIRASCVLLQSGLW